MPQTWKRMHWSACQSVRELALLLDAMPAQYREQIVRAAVGSEPTSTLEVSSVVGEVRSLIDDSVADLYGSNVSLRVESRALIVELGKALRRLTGCGDPAAVQLVVCDLIEVIAPSLVTDSHSIL